MESVSSSRKVNAYAIFWLLPIILCLYIVQVASAVNNAPGIPGGISGALVDVLVPGNQPIIVDKMETSNVYVESGMLDSDWDNVFSKIMSDNTGSDDEVEKDKFPISSTSSVVVMAVECDKRTEQNVLKITCSDEVVYNAYLLEDPCRLVLDIKNAILTQNIPLFEINDEIVQRIRVSQNTSDTVRVVADLNILVGYEVANIAGGAYGLEIFFNHYIKDINFEHTASGGRLNVISSGELQYSSMMLFDPARIVLDIHPATLLSPLSINSDLGDKITSIRASQFTSDTVRVVMDLVKPVSYSIVNTPWTSWKLSINLSSIVSTVHYASEPGKTKVSIPFVDPTAHTAMYFSNPERIVVDLPGVVVGTETSVMSVDDGIVRGVRIGQFEPETARVVIDLENRSSYDIRENDDGTGLLIEVFKPTLLGKTIAIDPGHGGSAPGAVGPSGLQEKIVNLDIALRLNKLLLEAGARTIMTRTDDSYVFIPDRAEIANNNNVDIFICIHSNYAKKDYASGTETFYYPNRQQSQSLAETIQASMISRLGLENRRAKPEEYLVLRLTSMPAVLVEVAFLSNQKEERLLADASFRQAAAEAIFQGILNYFSTHR
jgi:N-acetylmuramoyl-L-alanine amidase